MSETSFIEGDRRHMDEVQRVAGDRTINFRFVRLPQVNRPGPHRRADPRAGVPDAHSAHRPAAERVEFPGKELDPGISPLAVESC